MGMDLYTHIGCYVDAPSMKQIIEEKHYRCSSVTCKNHRHMKEENNYCPICGGEGETYTTRKEVNGHIDLYDFASSNGLGEDDLWMANDTNSWLPNRGYGGVNKTLDSHSNSLVFEIENTDVEKSKESFKKVYKNYLDKFKEVYGIELEVKFGIVAYYA